MPVVKTIIDAILNEIKSALSSYLNKLVRVTARLLIAIIIGTTFLVLGLIFVLVGSVFYLSLLMSSWLAWEVVGIITLLLGALVILLTVRR